MKNKRIIDSWNKIELDSTADARMLSAILARNHSSKSERGKVFPMNKILNWKRLAPIAACFVLVVILVTVVGNNNGWFGGNSLSTDLGDGTKLNFYKGDVPGSADFAFDFDVTSRDLTEEECRTLFGDLSATAYGMFNSETRSFMRLEGVIGDTKVIVAVPGVAVTDTPHEGNENVSVVNGIKVAAGYFITDANSKGAKDIIYFASFELGDVTVLVELGGAESESENLRSTISSVIEQLIKNGAPDLSGITA